jgi:hypothetical protein
MRWKPLYGADVNISQAARERGVTRDTIHLWLKRGRLVIQGNRIVDAGAAETSLRKAG